MSCIIEGKLKLCIVPPLQYHVADAAGLGGVEKCELAFSRTRDSRLWFANLRGDTGGRGLRRTLGWRKLELIAELGGATALVSQRVSRQDEPRFWGEDIADIRLAERYRGKCELDPPQFWSETMADPRLAEHCRVGEKTVDLQLAERCRGARRLLTSRSLIVAAVVVLGRDNCWLWLAVLQLLDEAITNLWLVEYYRTSLSVVDARRVLQGGDELLLRRVREQDQPQFRGVTISDLWLAECFRDSAGEAIANTRCSGSLGWNSLVDACFPFPAPPTNTPPASPPFVQHRRISINLSCCLFAPRTRQTLTRNTRTRKTRARKTRAHKTRTRKIRTGKTRTPGSATAWRPCAKGLLW
ncbi:hypothetical protein C7212DRAFT_348847 [Tuber magnatum]|uniref:Uncharacterized protein n=1 Tax=Tuber magnatum TaxID=42249 RepID=A0A317SEQ5_9PEZI|nr:hypothetical protein C7212DRAFT_348847 [Tuber magnatum]